MSDAIVSNALPSDEKIKPMEMNDLPSVHQLECICQRNPWSLAHFQAEFNNRFASIDLFWCNRSLAGFICSWLIAEEIQVQNIAVLPSMRRKRIAWKLLNHVIEKGEKEGARAVYLEVRAGNSPAKAFYQKYGFHVDGMRKAYYPDGEDAILMSLPLDSNSKSGNL